MNLLKSDPRLTAFVLGELSETETQELQTALDANAELRTEVDAIRQTVAQIETAMQNEPLPGKIGIIPKRKNWFVRIAAVVSVTALLLIAGIAVFAPELLNNKQLANMTLPDLRYGGNRIEYKPPESSRVKHDEISSEEIPAGSVPSLNREQRDDGIFESLKYMKKSLNPTESVGEKTVEELPEKLEDQKSLNVNGGRVRTETIDRSGQIAQTLPNNSTSNNSISGSGEVSRRAGYGVDGKAVPESMPQSLRNSSNTTSRLDNKIKMGISGISEMQNLSGASGKRIEPKSVAEDMDQKLVWYDSYNNANAEAYKMFVENEFKPVKVGEFSTFSIDVDTASYTTMRRYINEMGKRPPVESIRLEEFINYFKYDYAPPTDTKPFATHVDVSPCPWEPKHLLARIGIKGKEYNIDERPPLNLVFLIDVSGSMSASNRLPLVKRGLTELVEMLQPKDRVAIVTYAGSSQIALPSVSGQEKQAILDSINGLGAGGSTAGAAGIKTAYEVARKYYNKKAQNRVILCTDGDFNVGETNNKTLETMIGDEAKSGVFLTILGFGMGNYKDDRLKTLSMRGNGNYGYIDTIEEARRLLVEGLTGTLFAIAKDVKIQVDFNPGRVAGYRLLGYENRKLRDEDFHNDKIDAGEIGAGHTVTALYELVPAGTSIPAAVDKSRYNNEPETPHRETSGAAEKKPESSELANELMFVKLRYKLPDSDKSSLMEYPVTATTTEMSDDSQCAAAAALFGMLLRESRFAGNANWDTVLELATPNVKDDSYRKEFLELVKKAKELR
ncbi:MAG: von Willebrand factor type A domain-containing protein [Planctomycetaceae bacterium]|nr:von Willebrand factor type A domain-containing protein [Planctomycetaceae bacterium]